MVADLNPRFVRFPGTKHIFLDLNVIYIIKRSRLHEEHGLKQRSMDTGTDTAMGHDVDTLEHKSFKIGH